MCFDKCTLQHLIAHCIKTGITGIALEIVVGRILPAHSYSLSVAAVLRRHHNRPVPPLQTLLINRSEPSVLHCVSELFPQRSVLNSANDTSYVSYSFLHFFLSSHGAHTLLFSPFSQITNRLFVKPMTFQALCSAEGASQLLVPAVCSRCPLHALLMSHDPRMQSFGRSPLAGKRMRYTHCS